MPDSVLDEIARRWPAACAAWSPYLQLSAPGVDSAQEAIAQIDLRTRRVTLNDAQIREGGLEDCVEALLAHEVGHHVKHPGSLAVDARLRLLERGLIPWPEYSLVNAFTDLLINHTLAERHHAAFVRLYRASTDRPTFLETWHRDPPFVFTLALYEPLWGLEPGAVLGPVEPAFAARYPRYRAEATLCSERLFAMHPNVYAQFLWYLSFALRYLPSAEELASGSGCSRVPPSPDDWAQAVTAGAREREAIARAREERWFPEGTLDSLDDLEARIASLPGASTADLGSVPEIMAAYYRQRAEAYLFRPPAQPKLGEAVVPTTVEEWEPSDGVAAIDWLTTLSQRGAGWGGAAPLTRTRIAEQEGADVPVWQPRMEIYLDVSGSMPDPCSAINAMTLAAQILVLATTRAGGRVRAALYSTEAVTHWEWSRSELELSRFLLHYIGGGTEFPFVLLGKSLAECGRDQPIRVILTDRDFDKNVAAHAFAPELLRDAARRSPVTLLVQLMPDPDPVAAHRALGLTVIGVSTLDDFPRVARDLAWSLFPDGGG